MLPPNPDTHLRLFREREAELARAARHSQPERQDNVTGRRRRRVLQLSWLRALRPA